MDSSPQTPAVHRRPLVRAAMAVLAFLLLSVILVAPAQALVSAPPASDPASVGPSGDLIVLPPAPTVAVAATQSSPTGPTTLGLDIGDLNPCSWGAAGKASCDVVKETVSTVAACTGGLLVDRSLCGREFGDLVGAVVDLVGAGVTGIQRLIVVAVNKQAMNAAVELSDFVLGTLLTGDYAIASPRLDPSASDAPPGTGVVRPNIDPEWFVGQASLMRSIGIYFIAPLMMLVVMQAIVKGSIFFLLRSALVLLPIAIIGSVVLVQMTDLMLAISDDMSKAIANSVLKEENFKEDMAAALRQMAPESMGFFNLMWIFIFIFGTVAIFVELLIRETGIYLAAFFLPLAFSAMVWPATAKWARRLVEILLGLIFSKVFITAALTLGIAGMSNTINEPVTVPAASTGVDPAIATAAAKNEAATTSAAAMSAIMIMAAFAGAKIMAIGPGIEGAAAGRVFDTKQAWQKGQAASAGATMANKRAGTMLSKIKPAGKLINK